MTTLLARAADLIADWLGGPLPVATCTVPGAGWLAALADDVEAAA